MATVEDQTICPACTKRYFCKKQPQTVGTCDDFIVEYSAAHWVAQKRSEELEREDGGEEARE